MWLNRHQCLSVGVSPNVSMCFVGVGLSPPTRIYFTTLYASIDGAKLAITNLLSEIGIKTTKINPILRICCIICLILCLKAAFY